MAARGAYVEAEGHCIAALELVDELKEPDDRRMLQFRLLIQLGVVLTGEHGYSAAVVEDVYRRAHAVCGDSVEAEMLYPIMRGQATVNLVRGNLATAYDLSVECLQLARRSKRVEYVIDAMSMLCYTTLYYRPLEECRGWIERCLDLYRAEHGDRLTYPIPQDAGTAAMALLPTVAWLLGDSDGAEAAVRVGLEHVERLNRDFDKAFLHAWIAGARYTQRRFAEALQHASIAVEISQQHGYREWYATGALVALMSQAALNPDPQAVAQAAAACTAFEREGVGLNASFYLWGLARGYANAGDAESARQMLAAALERAETSGETRMNAELLILQAELELDDAIAVRLLDSALALAGEQGAVPTALRAAAAATVRLRGDAARTEYARKTLDILDGRSAYPGERDWMQAKLSKLRTPTRTRIVAKSAL
jgi:tetratricopeptide (TPR) repeat protein